MRFTYTYRSSDGQRHEAEIDALSRDEAFAALRGQGVKPIKMSAADGSKANGLPPGGGLRFGIAHAAAIALAAAAVVGGVWWLASRRGGDSPMMVMTPQGPVTYTVAMPLPRQAIPGDRRRIEAAQRWSGETNSVFRHSAECLLARYAEPGRKVPTDALKPSAEEFAAALKETMRLASTDFTEVVDLKRMVEGMKREMRAYLAGGGTAEGYLDELERRQRLEISYRENAEDKLERMLEEISRTRGPRVQDLANGRAASSTSAAKPAALPTDPPSPAADDKLKAAYDYWLKANARLKSMGIYELSLPDALRAMQNSLEMDE